MQAPAVFAAVARQRLAEAPLFLDTETTGLGRDADLHRSRADTELARQLLFYLAEQCP